MFRVLLLQSQEYLSSFLKSSQIVITFEIHALKNSNSLTPWNSCNSLYPIHTYFATKRLRIFTYISKLTLHSITNIRFFYYFNDLFGLLSYLLCSTYSKPNSSLPNYPKCECVRTCTTVVNTRYIKNVILVSSWIIWSKLIYAILAYS